VKQTVPHLLYVLGVIYNHFWGQETVHKVQAASDLSNEDIFNIQE